ncbi:hypothetical protein CYMTET_24250 [Cymbomonas tetramitiformis]|uniref:Sulfotransferase n=1 Tax=Cymbomonas tetramitiformis TaxID=36881 RepID=A0AAE0L085_9CHLO|nr:hypothetical protein CYMTET_24250 [Cymbomonas tetramitiformis]
MLCGGVDPADRLSSRKYSAVYPEGPNLSAEGFDKYAHRVVNTWNTCLKNHPKASCIHAFNPQQLIKGMYAEFFPDWLAHFPKDQLLVIKFEEYSKNLAHEVMRVFDFLQLRHLDDRKQKAILQQERANKRRSGSGEPMLDKTRAFLSDFFAPYNAALRNLLNDSRYDWS